jgi:hypothetical protein
MLALPSKHEALISTPSKPKERKEKGRKKMLNLSLKIPSCHNNVIIIKRWM